MIEIDLKIPFEEISEIDRLMKIGIEGLSL
jgi:hypothetical protein